MPGFVITLANPATCTHGGKSTPVPPAGRVLIGGVGAFTLIHGYVIAGCGFPAATLGAQPPCVKGQFFSGSKRVLSMGVPLAILPESIATSKGLPNPTPLIVMPAPPSQQRVIAS
jgi:hypothetical protein